jgi:hypothetical protein
MGATSFENVGFAATSAWATPIPSQPIPKPSANTRNLADSIVRIAPLLSITKPIILQEVFFRDAVEQSSYFA